MPNFVEKLFILPENFRIFQIFFFLLKISDKENFFYAAYIKKKKFTYFYFVKFENVLGKKTN